MRKLLLLGLALVAVYMGGRALKRNAEVLQALWVLIGMTAMAGTANTPKTRSTEARLNSLVPVVFPNTGGTITGNVNVTGNHTVGGSVSAGNQMLVNATGSARMEVGGNGHVTGGLQVDGNHVVGGSVSTGGQVLVNNATSGATFAVNGNGHITSGLQVDGTLVTASGSGMPTAAPSNAGSPSSTYNVAWAASVTNVLNDVIANLRTAGVFH